MTVLSILRGFKQPTAAKNVISGLLSKQCIINPTAPLRSVVMSMPRRAGDHLPTHQTTFEVTPSRYVWYLYKNLFHFYFMLGAIPLTALVFFVNVFIGPPTLQEIPEGYTPKHWEYERHPISRFLTRYGFWNVQELYERNLFYIQEEREAMAMRALEWKAKRLMKERGDYPTLFQKRINLAKYIRGWEEEHEYQRDVTGKF